MYFIDVHTHQNNTAKDVISIKNYFPKEIPEINLYYSIGIHPWYLNEFSLEDELSIIENQLKNSNCLAIGECGLDRLCKTDFELQKNVLIYQQKLAEKHQKPLIIHCVKAHHELIKIIKNEKINVPVILHGFSKKEVVHQLLLTIPNIYFSFGKSLLSSKITQQNFLETPIERIFLETDDSFLNIEEIYLKAASLKNCSLESLKNQLFLNFQKVFKTDL